MSRLTYASATYTTTTLTSVATSITVTDAARLPGSTSLPYSATLSDVGGTEVVTVTAIAGNTLTVTRAGSPRAFVMPCKVTYSNTLSVYLPIPGGGALGTNNAGKTTVNFGSAPGASDTSAAVTGQTGILAGSVVEAWIEATATADHSVDEHRVEPIVVTAGSISAGVGFTIYARLEQSGPRTNSEDIEGNAPRAYGLWTVGWRWS